jgi:ArsR family transcriptional regulator, virulence genes transcriptional regulator
VDWSHLEIELTVGRTKAVAHRLRLFIICLLLDGERSVGDICQAAGTSQPNISKHLSKLVEQGLLKFRKEKNRIFYSVADTRIAEVIGVLRTIYSI